MVRTRFVGPPRGPNPERAGEDEIKQETSSESWPIQMWSPTRTRESTEEEWPIVPWSPKPSPPQDSSVDFPMKD